MFIDENLPYHNMSNNDQPTSWPRSLNVSFHCLLEGTHQVVVQRDPFDGVAESVALGLLTGLAAGAAMRSFLWMPLFFFCWDDLHKWHDSAAQSPSLPTDSQRGITCVEWLSAVTKPRCSFGCSVFVSYVQFLHIKCKQLLFNCVLHVCMYRISSSKVTGMKMFLYLLTEFYILHTLLLQPV